MAASSKMPYSKVPLSTGWSFKQEEWSSDEWLSVEQVPSQIHMDLLAHEKIPDPYVDFNERAVQWVGEKVWLYRVPFTIPASEEATSTDLVFEGLDTFATVTLNGIEILSSDNMFVSYRVNVDRQLVRGGENLLEIRFDSSLLRGRQLVEEHRHEHNFLVRQTEVGRVAVRKAQYNWGWDWGPILMTAGPWKPVYLESYVARIDDVWAQNEVSNDLKTCSGSIHVRVDGNVAPTDKVVVALSLNDGVVFQQQADIGNGNNSVSVPFTLQDPQLWWPLHYGKQTRYKLAARVVRGNDTLHSLLRLVGFRRTQLVQEPDQHGKSFYMRVNNVDIFAGGSCWIPADSFLSRISPKRYRDWVALAARGNQVMLRVWGGGVYEDDALLEACDELGVLVWHDFQFACANYPAYPSYLASVELESRQQLRRMRWRPSVVMWAGNNEDYQVQERYKLDYDFEGDKDPESWLKSSFPARYIYEHLLPKLVQEEDPHNIYHPSSPWGDGKDTADPTVGDIHQWNLWHGTVSKYQELDTLGGRFVSEFGMEAYPHLQTVRRMTTHDSQLYPGSMTLDFHNKGIFHERRMATYVSENFRQTTQDVASYTYLTQVVQAEAMRAAYKMWRRDWRGRKCGGVLVWQLNDCWPTMSWAVVDYYLLPKPGFYAIARALRPIDIGVVRTYHDWTQTTDLVDEISGLRTGQIDQTIPARSGSTYDVWIASSRVEDIPSAEVVVRFISVRTGKDVTPGTRKTNITIAGNTTTDVVASEELVPSIPEEESTTTPFDVSKWDPYVVHATLYLQGREVASDTAWPEPIKFLDVSDRGVRFSVNSAKDEITVTADKPVKALVFEEIEGVKLSDNGFDLMPGENIVVKVDGAPADSLKWTCVGEKPSRSI